MIKVENFKEHILHRIYDNFYTSSDYNGLPLYNLYNEINSSIIKLLIELINEESICIIANSHDENPHIIRFGFVSKEKQIDYLLNYDGKETVCVYPSPVYLNEHRDVSNLILQPFKKMMALGFPQCKACYFNYDIINNYASDPRMNLKFNEYYGSIDSNDDIDDAKSIHLRTFGIGRMNETIIIVSYPRYLQEMSTSNQFLWMSHRIEDESDCKTLKFYQDNQFRESWVSPNTVYSSILQEISNINELTIIAFNKPFFLKIYSKSDIPDFDILTFPSLNIYNNFLLLLEKIVISNIDIHFFKLFVEIVDKDKKPKGSLVCLKEWIKRVNQVFAEEIYSPLHKVRRERQPAAHRIATDKYSNTYLLKQHQLCSEVYDSLNILRRLINSLPEVKNYTVKYPNTQYIEI